MTAGLRLITVPTSPFAARIKIQAYAKGLDLATMAPPGGMGSKALRALNPFGKVPVLMSDDQPIIESAAIQEYLEDLYPEPSLRGESPLVTAQARAYVRAIDLYLFPLLFALRAAAAPHDKKGAKVAVLHTKTLADAFATTLEKLGGLHGDQGYSCGKGLTLADCALVPVKFYCGRFLAGQDIIAPFSRYPVYTRWWNTVSRHPAVGRGLGELEAALSH